MNHHMQTKINTIAVIALTKAMREGANRRQAILLARATVMATQDINRDAAELACWRAMADLEATKVPPGHSIDIAASNSQLLVIRTPEQKLVFTLADLIGLHSQHGEKRIDTEVIKPTIH